MSGPTRWLVVSRCPRPHQTVWMLVDNGPARGHEVATFRDWATAEGVAAVLNTAGPKAFDDATADLRASEPF